MNSYQNRGYMGIHSNEQYAVPDEDDDDFDINEEWHEEEFDENVSHASSRANNTIVDSQRSTRLQNQFSKNTAKDREIAPRVSSAGIKKASSYNYRVASHDDEIQEEGEYDYDGQGAYEDGDYLVVGEEVVEEEHEGAEPQKDFMSAYDKLVERMHMEQGNDLLLNEEEFQKAMEKKEMRKHLKEKTDERIKEFQENKRRKMEMIKQENERKEVEDCTFKPQLISKPISQRRNFQQFLEDQKKYEEDRALKRNLMLEEESKTEIGEIHNPKINETSRKMLAKRKDVDKPAYERLYGISKQNKKLNQIINDADTEHKQNSEFDSQRYVSGKSKMETNESETFAPKINQRSKEIAREHPVQDLLYNDALRRKDMNELRQKENTMKEKSKRNRKVNESNIEYLIHKFNKEFEPTFEAIVAQNEDGPSEILNYRQLGELLFDMGFLSGASSSESEERILLSSMWTGLGGAQNEGLHKEVIRAFLLAVEGVKITDSVKAPSEEEFGQMKDGDFYPDCPKIVKHFRLMYLNRMRHCSEGVKSKVMKTEAEASQD